MNFYLLKSIQAIIYYFFGFTNYRLIEYSAYRQYSFSKVKLNLVSFALGVNIVLEKDGNLFLALSSENFYIFIIAF